ncbi:MAG: DUF177 domain-containing protein [Chloroflexi bacterium]|nr:DUF177 domain-containing protein [Chloroflexota bacterium]MCC6892088.1 DUF177 domain-containing protein [Anaerolineae bacterium]
MNTYVSNRVLKINVGFLLAAGVGNHHDSAFDVPTVKVADDLTVDYVRGPIRLSRTAAGILVQGQLEVGITGECYRCLDDVTQNVTIPVEELYAYPPTSTSEFSVLEDAVLDLAPLLRAEVMLASTNGVLCREDCKGLCPECGTNLNYDTCDCASNAIDPRLAGLKNFLK